MPRVPNKIIINCLEDRGRYLARRQEYRALSYLAGEMTENNLHLDPDFDVFLIEMELECSRVHASDDQNIAFLRDFKTRLRHKIDEKLSAKPPANP